MLCELQSIRFSQETEYRESLWLTGSQARPMSNPARIRLSMPATDCGSLSRNCSTGASWNQDARRATSSGAGPSSPSSLPAAGSAPWKSNLRVRVTTEVASDSCGTFKGRRNRNLPHACVAGYPTGVDRDCLRGTTIHHASCRKRRHKQGDAPGAACQNSPGSAARRISSAREGRTSLPCRQCPTR